MKARNIALIGLGLLAVGGGMLYFLKEKGIIGNNENSGGTRPLTNEEIEIAKAHLVDAANSGLIDSTKQFTTKDALLNKIGFTRDQYDAAITSLRF